MASPITVMHSDIIRSHILNRLDGSALASTSCASSQLFSLCSDENLWREICNSIWPSTNDLVRDVILSFPFGHRSFYSDAFLAIHRTNKGNIPAPCDQLISAVDIFCDDKLIYSKVIVTETLSGPFTSSPFRLDILDSKETVRTPLVFDGNCKEAAFNRFRVSWIMIDPTSKRAVNAASVKPVEARWHWLKEELHVHLARVVDSRGSGEIIQFGVTVACCGKKGEELQLSEVSMRVEDMEGNIICGKEGLIILQETMAMRRCKANSVMEKEMYDKFMRMEINVNGRKQRREWSFDMVPIVSIFMLLLLKFVL